MIELFLNKQWYLFYLLAIMIVSGLVKDKGYLNKVFNWVNKRLKNKKAIVAIREKDGSIKIIRFGDQKMGHNYSAEARKSFKARHGKNIAKGKTSAAYWANKMFWSGSGGLKKSPPKSQKHKKGV